MALETKVILEASLQEVGFQLEQAILEGFRIDPKNPLNQVWTQFEVHMIRGEEEKVEEVLVVEDAPATTQQKQAGRPRKQ